MTEPVSEWGPGPGRQDHEDVSNAAFALTGKQDGWMDESCLTTHRHNLGHPVS